ncbi:hypothetical protein THAOC_05390 [Thalassiosira oceanica]|uniref:RanBP2-type domain-containing protein n=1 Tax=Thalassiosira oceanica TaxID=159749 RepID=K0T7C0_THAOC|nr:hypothetical protein THAOC_05390 [Thalassiosira oceanica]|eukprot:EJK73014.1 hypothetical protein THAOC_05390 [Thalassiosira oceanica]
MLPGILQGAGKPSSKGTAFPRPRRGGSGPLRSSRPRKKRAWPWKRGPGRGNGLVELTFLSGLEMSFFRCGSMALATCPPPNTSSSRRERKCRASTFSAHARRPCDDKKKKKKKSRRTNKCGSGGSRYNTFPDKCGSRGPSDDGQYWPEVRQGSIGASPVVETLASEIDDFNGYLRPAESQVNYKYVQMDVEALNDGLSRNIHRSMAVASQGPFACFWPLFTDSPIDDGFSSQVTRVSAIRLRWLYGRRYLYQTSRCNGKFVHHRTSPSYRGPGAVDNVISIEAGGYREVRCGIELSPRSAAARVHRGPSAPPSGPISVLGSSAAPRRHLCRLASRPSSDLQIRRRRCRGELVYKSSFDVANRCSMEARGRGAIRSLNATPLRLRFQGTDFLDVGLVPRQRGPRCPSTWSVGVGTGLVGARSEGGWTEEARAAVGGSGRGRRDGEEGWGREDPTKKPPSKRARTGGVEQKGKRSGRGRNGGASGPNDGVCLKDDGSEPRDETLTKKSVAAISVESKEDDGVSRKAVMGKSESERASTADEYPDFAISGSDWNCQHCTLINPVAISVCNVCERRRGSTRGRNGRRSAPPAICVGVERSGDDVKSHEALVTSSKRRKKHRKKKKKKKKKNAHDRDEDESTEKRCLGVKLVTTELNSTAAKVCDTPNKAGEQKLAPSDGPNIVHLSELNAGVMAEERKGEGQTREEEDAAGQKPTTSKPAGVTPQGQLEPSSHRASSHKIQIKGPGRYVFHRNKRQCDRVGSIRLNGIRCEFQA